MDSTETRAVRASHRRRGQAFLEFALVLPFMVLVLLIAVDFGRLFFSYIQVTNAAREAANNAASNAVDYHDGNLTSSTYYAGVVNAASQEMNAQGQQGATASPAVSSPACFTPSAQAISCDQAPGGIGIGNQVSVTVTQPFTFFTPLIGNFFDQF